METGEHGHYRWLESELLCFEHVFRLAPELLSGLVVVTTFDSAELRLTPDETEAGWVVHGRCAIPPGSRALAELQWDGWDELYVLSGGKTPLALHSFVNDGSLQLSPARETTDCLGDASRRAQIEATRMHFWEQLEAETVETYLAQNDCLTLVSRRREAFERFVLSLSQTRSSL